MASYALLNPDLEMSLRKRCRRARVAFIKRESAVTTYSVLYSKLRRIPWADDCDVTVPGSKSLRSRVSNLEKGPWTHVLGDESQPREPAGPPDAKDR